MKKTVELDQLTDEEGRALVRFVHNRVAEGDLHDHAQRLDMSVEDLMEVARGTREERDAHVRKWLEVIDAAHHAGRLQDPILRYLRVWQVDRLLFHRGVHQEDDPEFAEREQDLDERKNRVRALHGLPEWRWWPPGTGLAEAEELTQEDLALHDQRLTKVLREFGLEGEAENLEKDPKEFHRELELGRRAARGELSDEEIADVLREQYLSEAHASAVMGAYQAAAAMVGAAMEAVLLARCLRSASTIAEVVAQIDPRERPKRLDPRAWTFANMCRVADTAGWLPDFRANEVDFVLTGDSLINLVKDLRNMLHPARHLRHAAKQRYDGMVARAQYEDALSAYELLVRHLLA